MKYCNLHKGHDLNTDDCIQLKDVIEGLIKRGRLDEYVKGCKKEKEEPPKGKSPSKTLDAETSDEVKKESKWKGTYISTITKGAPCENLHSKGTMKWKITNMLIVHKKDGGTSGEGPKPTYVGVPGFREGRRSS